MLQASLRHCQRQHQGVLDRCHAWTWVRVQPSRPDSKWLGHATAASKRLSLMLAAQAILVHMNNMNFQEWDVAKYEDDEMTHIGWINPENYSEGTCEQRLCCCSIHSSDGPTDQQKKNVIKKSSLQNQLLFSGDCDICGRLRENL